MSVLSAYIGASSVNALLYFDEKKFSYINFPFVYSDSLFSNYTNPTDFYKEIFKNICKQNKAKFSECDILLTGYAYTPDINIETALSMSLNEALNSVTGYFPIVVNNCSVVTTRNVLSYVDLLSKTKEGEPVMSLDEINHYANLTLYPQIAPVDMSVKLNIDKNISSKTHVNPIALDENSPLLFTGSRFNRLYNPENPELDYMLMLSLLDAEGIYEIKLDRDISAILMSMLKVHLKSAGTIEDTVEPAGVLVSSSGEVECLVESDMGTQQMIDVEKNRIFILPVDASESVRLLIKSVSFGTVEKVVSGGSLGVVFDTREVKADMATDIKFFDSSLHVFSRALNRIT
jgi:hypothetical protein